MKKIVIITLATILSLPVFAAVIQRSMDANNPVVRLDASKKNILIDVVYGGGCIEEHDFKLKIGKCDRGVCRADLLDLTVDPCKSLLYETAVISIKEAGLANKHLKGYKLQIFADLVNGIPTVGEVYLP